jgi:hypothetical protein
MTQTLIVILCILAACVAGALMVRLIARRRAFKALDAANRLGLFLTMREYAYADAGMEKVLAMMSNLDTPIRDAIAAARAGDFDEAQELLDAAEGPPDVLYHLVDARIKQARGDMKGAREAARVILNPNEESRAKMGAWTVLRELGDKPGEQEANQVLGVVIEFLIGRNAVLLSGYSDGDARLITSSGFGMIGMMQEHPEIREAAKALVKAAEPLVGLFEIGTDRPLPLPDMLRIAVLTPAGMRAGGAAISDAATPENMLYSVWTATQDLLTNFRVVGQSMGIGTAES